jgi:hypothetical protein
MGNLPKSEPLLAQKRNTTNFFQTMSRDQPTSAEDDFMLRSIIPPTRVTANTQATLG